MQQGRFDERVRAASSRAREREDDLRAAERSAREDPVVAARWCLQLVVNFRRLYRRYLRSRFGCDPRRLDKPGRILNRTRRPRNRREKDLCLNALAAHSAFETAALAMTVAKKKAVGNSEDPASAICKAFFEAARVTPALYGEVMQRAKATDLKESGTQSLSGWLNTQLKPQINSRMAAALKESGADQPYDPLIRELPSAAFLAWNEWQRGEPLRSGSGKKSFVSRAARFLEQLGSIATEKQQVVSSAPYDAETVASSRLGDEDLEEFERAETMRQQLNALEQAARLSSQETEVIRRIRHNRSDAEIAAELEITKNNVQVTKHNAIAKLRKARSAAGL